MKKIILGICLALCLGEIYAGQGDEPQKNSDAASTGLEPERSRPWAEVLADLEVQKRQGQAARARLQALLPDYDPTDAEVEAYRARMAAAQAPRSTFSNPSLSTAASSDGSASDRPAVPTAADIEKFRTSAQDRWQRLLSQGKSGELAPPQEPTQAVVQWQRAAQSLRTPEQAASLQRLKDLTAQALADDAPSTPRPAVDGAYSGFPELSLGADHPEALRLLSAYEQNLAPILSRPISAAAGERETSPSVPRTVRVSSGGGSDVVDLTFTDLDRVFAAATSSAPVGDSPQVGLRDLSVAPSPTGSDRSSQRPSIEDLQRRVDQASAEYEGLKGPAREGETEDRTGTRAKAAGRLKTLQQQLADEQERARVAAFRAQATPRSMVTGTPPGRTNPSVARSPFAGESPARSDGSGGSTLVDRPPFVIPALHTHYVPPQGSSTAQPAQTTRPRTGRGSSRSP